MHLFSTLEYNAHVVPLAYLPGNVHQRLVVEIELVLRPCRERLGVDIIYFESGTIQRSVFARTNAYRLSRSADLHAALQQCDMGIAPVVSPDIKLCAQNLCGNAISMHDKGMLGVMMHLEVSLALKPYLTLFAAELLRIDQSATGIEHHFGAIGKYNLGCRIMRSGEHILHNDIAARSSVGACRSIGINLITLYGYGLLIALLQHHLLLRLVGMGIVSHDSPFGHVQPTRSIPTKHKQQQDGGGN